MIGKQFVFRWWGLPKCNNWFGFCIFLCWWEVNPPNIFVVFCFYFSHKLSPSVFSPLSAPFPWFIKSALNSTWMQENQSALNSPPHITREEGGGEGKRWSSNCSNSGLVFPQVFLEIILPVDWIKIFSRFTEFQKVKLTQQKLSSLLSEVLLQVKPSWLQVQCS